MQHEQSISCLSAFEQHHNDLLRFFTHKLGCRDLAADCAQETYVHLVRMRSTIDVQNPRAFLFRVAANLAVDNLRKIRIRRETLSVDPPPDNAASMAASNRPERSQRSACQRRILRVNGGAATGQGAQRPAAPGSIEVAVLRA